MKQASGLGLRIMSRGWNEKKKMEERYLVSVSCLHLMLKQGHKLMIVMDSLL